MNFSIDPQDTTWEMFIFELGQYIEKSERVYLSEKKRTLYLYDNDTNETTQISRYGAMIRKQVDNKGHVPLFFDISQLEFEIDEHYLIIKVELLNGMKKERKLFAQNIEE